MLFLRSSLPSTLTNINNARLKKGKPPSSGTLSVLRLTVIGNDGGVIDEARMMLANIYGWFTEGFDTADLRDAKALLDQLNVRLF
jgi:hypothetical protein